ncbi:hypothetical protein D9M73_81080 [compost metagenome]
MRMHQPVGRGQRLKLVGGGDKRQAGQAGQLGRDLFGITLGRVQPRTHRRAAKRQFIQMRQGITHVFFAVFQLGHITGKLLAQRQRCRVLQMRAPYLDDTVKVL